MNKPYKVLLLIGNIYHVHKLRNGEFNNNSAQMCTSYKQVW